MRSPPLPKLNDSPTLDCRRPCCRWWWWSSSARDAVQVAAMLLIRTSAIITLFIAVLHLVESTGEKRSGRSRWQPQRTTIFQTLLRDWQFLNAAATTSDRDTSGLLRLESFRARMLFRKNNCRSKRMHATPIQSQTNVKYRLTKSEFPLIAETRPTQAPSKRQHPVIHTTTPQVQSLPLVVRPKAGMATSPGNVSRKTRVSSLYSDVGW